GRFNVAVLWRKKLLLLAAGLLCGGFLGRRGGALGDGDLPARCLGSARRLGLLLLDAIAQARVQLVLLLRVKLDRVLDLAVRDLDALPAQRQRARSLKILVHREEVRDLA